MTNVTGLVFAIPRFRSPPDFYFYRVSLQQFASHTAKNPSKSLLFWGSFKE